ncbi:MAG: single-stranded DNA-binding protein [bacterium]|nr:single-stranded DNA-binding protein [bacterium]
MANYNRVILAGNLTRDPELRHIPSGQPVVHFGVAVNRNFITQTGEKKEEVSFIPIIVWGKQAESCNKYLSKGSPVLLEGRIQQRSWVTTSGEKRSVLEVVADRVQFLGRRDAHEGYGDEYQETNKSDMGYPPSYEDDKGDDVPF